MSDDIWHAIAKEWYWIVIFSAIVGIAFAPSFLKAKCPACKRRQLRSVDLINVTDTDVQSMGEQPFTSFHRCDKCRARFKRVKTGPLEDASDSRFAHLFAEQ